MNNQNAVDGWSLNKSLLLIFYSVESMVYFSMPRPDPPILGRKRGEAMFFLKFVLSLLVSVLGSILGTLILQMLER